MSTNRREFIKKFLGAGVIVATVPSLGLPTEADLKPKPTGVLFVDPRAVDIEEFVRAGLEDSVFAGWHIIAVFPPHGMSVRDSLATSHDLDNVHILEKEPK